MSKTHNARLTGPQRPAPARGLIEQLDDRMAPTPLIAACRCFVASKLGDDVDIPKELT